MTELDNIHDINRGVCAFCNAEQGKPCVSDGCRNIRLLEVQVLRSKIQVLEWQIKGMVRPMNPKHHYFEMDEEMLAEAKTWLDKHKETCRVHKPEAYHGAIGGVITYSFTSTSIGQICTIKCACGESSDCSGLL